MQRTVIERAIIISSIYISGIVLAGVLIGLWRYGIDLSTVFLGTHWSSALPESRGTTAIEGGLVLITLVFGGLLVFGLAALVCNNKVNRKQPAQKKLE